MELLLEWVRTHAGPWALLAIFGGAAAEYMVPPLPADSVVLAGALLVIAGHHSFLVVFAVAVAGGMCGAMSHYWLGRRFLANGKLADNRWVSRWVNEQPPPSSMNDTLTITKVPIFNLGAQ